jgi:hypothetical protein
MKRVLLITILALLLIVATSATLAFAGRPVGQSSLTSRALVGCWLPTRPPGNEAAVQPMRQPLRNCARRSAVHRLQQVHGAV